MTWEEWVQVVARVNVSWPASEPLAAETARAWYAELAPLDAGDVLLAVRHLVRTSRFRPSAAELLDAVDAIQRDLRDAAREQHRALEARHRDARRGVPPPPEFVEARKVLTELVSRPGATAAERAAGVAMVKTLGAMATDRLAASQPAAADVGLRRCPECASATMAGFVDTTDDGVAATHPCPACRPGRYAAWASGRLWVRTDKAGHPREAST